MVNGSRSRPATGVGRGFESGDSPPTSDRVREIIGSWRALPGYTPICPLWFTLRVVCTRWPSLSTVAWRVRPGFSARILRKSTLFGPDLESSFRITSPACREERFGLSGRTISMFTSGHNPISPASQLGIPSGSGVG